MLVLSLLVMGVGTALVGLLPAEIRYSGASVAYGIGGVLGGAMAPIVATLLVASTGGLGVVGGYVALASLVSLAAVLTLRSPHAAIHADAQPVAPRADPVQDSSGT